MRLKMDVFEKNCNFKFTMYNVTACTEILL